MPHVGFHVGICSFLIVAVFASGLSLDDQFDLPVTHSGAVFSQALEPELDECKPRAATLVFLVVGHFLVLGGLGLKQNIFALSHNPSISPLPRYQLFSTYRI